MRRFALIGRGVSQSLSPIIYNWFFREKGYEARYTVIEPSEGLDGIAELLKRLDGFNVTIPYKKDILRYLDEVRGPAAEIGAVNTVKNEEGVLVGYNTDYRGFLKALSIAGAPGYDTVLMIGAGGAARAALYALRGLARRVYIVSRSGVSARELARLALSWGFRGSLGLRQGDPLVKEATSGSDLIVNASPVGSDGASTPIDPALLREPCTVIDMVYRPLETPLLKASRRAGCRTVDGLWMLAGQASENLWVWLRARASPEKLREAALRGLKHGVGSR